jgi:phage anti-repressor protein
MESARNSVGQSREGRLEDAYSKARQLAEGLESMQQRLRGQEAQQPGSSRGSGGEGKGRPEETKSTPAGAARGPSGTTTGLPTDLGGHRDEEARQLRREFQQRLMDAEELRRLLDRNATQMETLYEVISALRLMQGIRRYDDPAEIARLRSAIELLRQVELDLGRELGRLARKGQYQQADDNDVPQDYRKLVEEYYKALARGKP